MSSIPLATVGPRSDAHVAASVPKGASIPLERLHSSQPGGLRFATSDRRKRIRSPEQSGAYDDEEVVYVDDVDPRNKFPVKAALVALFLLVVGIVFSSIGLATVLRSSAKDAIPFLTIGGLAIIPGLFHITLLLCAYAGRPGYTYDLIPSVE